MPKQRNPWGRPYAVPVEAEKFGIIPKTKKPAKKKKKKSAPPPVPDDPSVVFAEHEEPVKDE